MFLVGDGFPKKLGVGIGFFCPTPDIRLDHFLHHTPNKGVPVEMVQLLLKLLLKQISCCAPRFPLILTANFIPFMLSVGSRSRKFWKGRIFYLRLRNPDSYPAHAEHFQIG